MEPDEKAKCGGGEIITAILPQDGLLKLHQIIGRSAVTTEQAAEHRKPAITSNGKPKLRPCRPRPGMMPLIPVSKATWYAGIKLGRYPAPVHFGKSAFWRVSDIRALLERCDVA